MSRLAFALGAARTAVDGAVAWGEMAVDDVAHLRHTLDGNDVDRWDPDYIRRVLPIWRAVMGAYFRGEGSWPGQYSRHWTRVARG